MTELRRAVAYCASLDQPWKADAVASLAPGTTRHAVVRYLGSLVTLKVLLRVGDEYRAGPELTHWRNHRPKTNAGGNARAYKAAKAARDQLSQASWMAGRGGVLTCQEATQGDKREQRRSGGDIVALAAELAEHFTIREVAAVLRVSERTVERRIKAGEIAVVTFGPRVVRVSGDEIRRLLTPRLSHQQEREACRG